MANESRYWVGGSGDLFDVNHWSETSGGVGGANYPAYYGDFLEMKMSRNGTLTVARDGNRVYKSLDQGTTWEEIFPAGFALKSWSNNTLNGIAVTDFGHIILTELTNVYISNDFGVTWSLISPNSVNTFYGCICNIDASYIMIWSNYDYMISNDFGVTWSYYTPPLRSYNTILPPSYDSTYVKATSEEVGYEAYRAVNPANSLTGDDLNNSWRTTNITQQRFHIDLGVAKRIKRIIIENYHKSGTEVDCGAKTILIYGSNTASAFTNLTYSVNTNWSLLSSSPATQFKEHSAEDSSYQEFVFLNNYSSYRYYCIKIADNHGDSSYLGIRRITLQEDVYVNSSYYITGACFNDNANYLYMAFRSATNDVYKSTDHGVNFSKTFSYTLSGQNNFINCDSNGEKIILYDDHFYISTDYGATFNRKYPLLYAQRYHSSISGDGLTIFCVEENVEDATIYKSIDDGENWTSSLLIDNYDDGYTQIQLLYVCVDNSQRVITGGSRYNYTYINDYGSRMFKSLNNGLDWSEINDSGINAIFDENSFSGSAIITSDGFKCINLDASNILYSVAFNITDPRIHGDLNLPSLITLQANSFYFFGTNISFSPTLVGQNDFYITKTSMEDSTANLSSNFEIYGELRIRNTTFNTNDFNIISEQIIPRSATINAGSSTITTRGIREESNGRSIFNYDTSTLVLNYEAVPTSLVAPFESILQVYVSGFANFYNLEIQLRPLYLNVDCYFTEDELMTCNNLIITGESQKIDFRCDVLTCNNLTISGTSESQRLHINISKYYEWLRTPKLTIIANTIDDLSNVDFECTIASGPQIPWTGTSLGDCGGNENITFDNPRDIYWVDRIDQGMIKSSMWQSHAALRKDGSIWMAGYNTYGQLGDGTKTDKSSPVSILGGMSFKDISCGYNHMMSIKGDDGSAWGWGQNGGGQLGDGTKTGKSSPVSVLGGISFSKIAVGYDHTIGIRAIDGSVWAWGYNSAGQLGDGTKTGKSSPVSILGGMSFKDISCGKYYTIAIKGDDGSAWAWGYNLYGQLGTGNKTSYSSPVSVLGGMSFTKISCSKSYGHTCGINELDGSAWAWGYNNNGQLGTGNKTSYSSPVSVLGGMSFIDISCGNYFTCAIRGSDHLGWAWGYNSNGELGDNSSTARSSPVSICGNFSFTSINCGESFTSCLNENGNWITWGYNNYGRLGIGSGIASSYTSLISSKIPIFIYDESNFSYWNDPSKWASSSGGTGGTERIPLPQDNIIFDENSFIRNGKSVKITKGYVGKIDFSNCTYIPNIEVKTYPLRIMGNFILKEGSRISKDPNKSELSLYMGRCEESINIDNTNILMNRAENLKFYFCYDINFIGDCYANIIVISEMWDPININLNDNKLYLINGYGFYDGAEIYIEGYDRTIVNFDGSYGEIICDFTTTERPISLNFQKSTINKLTILNSTSSKELYIEGNDITINEIESGPLLLDIGYYGYTTINNFNFTPGEDYVEMIGGYYLAPVKNTTPQINIFDNFQFYQIAGDIDSKWFLTPTSIGTGYCKGLYYAMYWVGGSGNWSDVNHWSLTSGGIGGTGHVPLFTYDYDHGGIADCAFFDENSFLNDGDTITIDVNEIPDTDFSYCTKVPNLKFAYNGTIKINGNLKLKEGMIVTKDESLTSSTLHFENLYKVLYFDPAGVSFSDIYIEITARFVLLSNLTCGKITYNDSIHTSPYILETGYADFNFENKTITIVGNAEDNQQPEFTSSGYLICDNSNLIFDMTSGLGALLSNTNISSASQKYTVNGFQTCYGPSNISRDDFVEEDEWLEIVFDTPFDYDGTSNLLIDMERNGVDSYQNVPGYTYSKLLTENRNLVYTVYDTFLEIPICIDSDIYASKKIPHLKIVYGENENEIFSEITTLYYYYCWDGDILSREGTQSRSQLLLHPEDFGNTGAITITGLKFKIYEKPGYDLGYISIKMQHTDLQNYDTSVAETRPQYYGNVSFINGESGNKASITGDIHINNLTFSNAPYSIEFESGKTVYLNDFICNGSSGNLFVLSSNIEGSVFYLDNKSNNDINASYCNIVDSTALSDKGKIWRAISSIDSGNNTGWIFEVLNSFKAKLTFII